MDDSELRRALNERGVMPQPPPDLADRVLARLPPTPAAAHQSARRRARRARTPFAIIGLLTTVLLAVGAINLLGGAPQLVVALGGSGSAIERLVSAVALPANTLRLSGPIGRAAAGVLFGGLLLVLTLVLLLVWPQRTRTAASALQHAPARAIAVGGGAGLVWLLLSGGVALLLAASIVGLPLALLLLIVLQLPFVCGFAALARLIGAHFGSDGMGSALAACALAVPVAIGAALAPYLWLMVFYLIAAPGLGGFVRSRGGTVIAT